MSDWGGKQRAAVVKYLDSLVSIGSKLQPDLRGYETALTEMEKALRSLVDVIEGKPGANGPFVDADNAERVLTKYRLPTEGTDDEK